MNRPILRLLFVTAALAVAGGSFVAWQGWRERHAWARMLPPLPPADGDAAPGEDARLAACAARLASWPPDQAALAEFTRVCHANGHLDEAVAGYQALIALDPHEPRWPHLLASILSGYGRMAESLPYLRRTTELAPDYLPGWIQLGNALLKSNATAEADAAYREALRREPDNPYALLGIARCDLQQNRLTAARSHLEQAVRAHPDFAATESLLATVFDQLGNPTAAASARQRVAHDGRYEDPPDPWTDELLPFTHNTYLLLVRAHAAITNLQPRDSLPPLRRALALAPNDAHVHRLLARALFLLDDKEGARVDFEAAARLAPADEIIQLDWIKFLHSAGDLAAVDRAVEQALHNCPDSAALHVEAAVLAARAGDLTTAARHYERAWTLQPDKPAAALELAAMHYSGNNYEQATEVLERVLAREPHNLDALRLLVRHGIEQGDRRTSGWLRAAIAAGETTTEVADLQQRYQRRFGAPLP